jgi:hypothetical protein
MDAPLAAHIAAFALSDYIAKNEQSGAFQISEM